MNPEIEKNTIGIDEIKTEAGKLIKRAAEIKQSNNFPIDVFPSVVQEIITATNEHLNFPIDFIGASILFAASVAIGNTHRVEVKKGWLESAVIYLAIVARAGTNKSHPLSFALQPIIEQDRKTFRQYERQRMDYERIINLSKKEREKENIDELPKPVWCKFLLSDYTPEALTEVHKFNKRGIGVYADELTGWFKNFNRYNKGSEMEFWLSLWNSKPINIDRKTGSSIFIPLPFISVGGTIQNRLLTELAKDSRTQNGFIDRILFVIPDNVQKPYWSETEINPAIITHWQTVISNILNIPLPYDDTHNPCPEIIKFTNEAKRLLFDWQRTNADQCNETANEVIGGIYSKMEMYAIRLALILEMIWFACGKSNKQAISIEAMQGALKLVAYFKNAAVKVNTIISNSNPLDNYPIDKQNLYYSLPQKFTTENGLQIANSLGVAERTFKRFLNEQALFSRINRGGYEKRI